MRLFFASAVVPHVEAFPGLEAADSFAGDVEKDREVVAAGLHAKFSRGSDDRLADDAEFA